MKLADVKVIASNKGVKAGRQTKVELIRAIQEAEGNPVCFATAQANECGQEGCLWRQDCC